ncbi:response regulator [Ruminiclostridium cellulolyticum]|uniref:response regulator n=1 Tax=Ruminiclostridium cellulolyticum TaxID=1521 RepID=UPI0000E98E22|nr:response regulator [Ruminiclostridium cellulolyticum]
MASILIVEDETVINELVKRNLQLVGHQCTSIFDGKTAVFEIQRQCYDLIILDIMLPGLDGFEVIKQSSETPTIFLTAKSSLAYRID